MLVGIGFIGVFRASIASFFIATEQQDEEARLEARLARIEAQLAELLNRRP
jgi:hypothetical protein